MLPHVGMISVFSSGPLRWIMTSYTLKFLEGVCNITPPLGSLINLLFIVKVDMDDVPSELHYRGDDQGTLAIVADG